MEVADERDDLKRDAEGLGGEDASEASRGTICSPAMSEQSQEYWSRTYRLIPLVLCIRMFMITHRS